jgi:hypothetical protein
MGDNPMSFFGVKGLVLVGMFVGISRGNLHGGTFFRDLLVLQMSVIFCHAITETGKAHQAAGKEGALVEFFS